MLPCLLPLSFFLPPLSGCSLRLEGVMLMVHLGSDTLLSLLLGPSGKNYIDCLLSKKKLPWPKLRAKLIHGYKCGYLEGSLITCPFSKITVGCSPTSAWGLLTTSGQVYNTRPEFPPLERVWNLTRKLVITSNQQLTINPSHHRGSHENRSLPF